MNHSPDAPSRYVVGIDLGTTNSAVAYVDTTESLWQTRDLALPQLVASGTVESRETLPSFHYEAAAGELAAGALKLPWDIQDPKYAVGFFARDHGAAVPGRLVVSAKSWLCHPGVDRTAGLLPWHGAADVERLSPVQVSARYLTHIRQAWDYRFPDFPLATQDVVLTVPASFDEVARELTVEAAVAAGLGHIVLLEEPQAAFYSWIESTAGEWGRQVLPKQKILVCDIGGGTSDFTLIHVRPAAGDKVLFHRFAVGEHLILGGDNLDVALAHYVERKIAGDGRLDPSRWGPLVRTCRAVKETLLGDSPPEHYVINVAGVGSKLIGGAQRVEITRDEIQRVLVDGFLPRVPLDAKPTNRRSGFQEFGLPYAPDPGITRYLAAFLSAHRDAVADVTVAGNHDPARPDIVLFNGGLFASPILRQRMLDVLSSWFTPPGTAEPWLPKVLPNDRLDLAVARGAAHYGMVRRGHGMRITGGSAQTYYIGVETAGEASPATALCLLPAGIEEGQSIDLSQRQFNLLIREPVEFPLYVSSTRTTDKPGELLPVDPLQMTTLPPIRTVLHSGKKAAADRVLVTLHARRTEIGTLDLWCGEVKGDRTWRLQFDVRIATRPGLEAHAGAAEVQGFVDENLRQAAEFLIRQSFVKGENGAVDRPEGLVKRLELTTAMTRHEWPASLLRSFWEVLMEVEPGRRISVEHEARWLNLAGFSLRPGYGLAVDDWRVAQTWKLFPTRTVFPKNELCKAEWWTLWRRVAGGLTQGQQHTLAEPLLAAMRTYLRKAGTAKGSPLPYAQQEGAEVFRVLASLEQLPVSTKIELGDMLLQFILRDRPMPLRDAAIWAIGRIGARVPVYGPLNAMVPAETAERWAARWLDKTAIVDDKIALALSQLTRRTGDRYRDVSEMVRLAAVSKLTEAAAPGHLIELVREVGQLQVDEQRLVFGESLPRGLRIE